MVSYKALNTVCELKMDDYVQDVCERDYYKNKNGVVSFPFLGDEWKTTMITEIWNLIKELYSDIISSR